MQEKKPVTIRGVTYPSRYAAAKALDISYGRLLSAAKNDSLDRVGMGGAMPITISGIRYESRTAAAAALGVKPNELSIWLKIQRKIEEAKS